MPRSLHNSPVPSYHRPRRMGGTLFPQPPWPQLPGWREPCLLVMAGVLVSLLSCARLGANSSLLDYTAWG